MCILYILSIYYAQTDTVHIHVYNLEVCMYSRNAFALIQIQVLKTLKLNSKP
jgi:hypothetical protein